MAETRLAYLTSGEVAALLARRPVAVLPMGSTEQHGPTGLCGTDALCAEVIAARAGAKCQCLVLPAIAITPAQFNLAFPGTISVRSRTLALYLIDIFESLRRQQIATLVIVNAHGANRSVIDSAMHDFYDGLDKATPRIECHNWWDLGEVSQLRRKLFGDGEGLHATPSEISITMAAHRDPKHAAPNPMTPSLSEAAKTSIAGDRHGPSVEHRETYPDGTVGSNPALASARHGEWIIEAAVTGLAALLDQTEKAPSSTPSAIVPD